MKKGDWKKFDAVTLKESVLGIIGFGKIGKAIAKRAKSFGMKILANDIRNISDKLIIESGIKLVSIDQILAESDFISLNCDLNKSSFKLISVDELNLMKNNSFLINTSRGSIVDELALIDALNNKFIAGAALDVFVEEPLPIDSPLRTMNNCLLSAHNSNFSPAVFDYIHRKTIKNLLKGLEID